MSVLNDKVLVLNRNWQAIGEIPVFVAMCDMARDAATGIDTETMRAVSWNEWLSLVVRHDDRSIRGVRAVYRVPTVVCKSSYSGMPKKRPKYSARNVAKRDKSICAYTGKFDPDGNVDHVIPVSRGGPDTWENVVWSSKRVNSQKGNLTPEEAGLHLLRKPFKPPTLEVCRTIQPAHPDWELFLPHQS